MGRSIVNGELHIVKYRLHYGQANEAIHRVRGRDRRAGGGRLAPTLPVLLLTAILAACGPSGARPPEAGAAPPGMGHRIGTTWLRHGHSDAILASSETQDVAIQERIDWWMDYWDTRARARFGRALVRMGRYEHFVDSLLAARRLPASLRYLPIIEASYNPTAESRVGAAGLWQFMPRTARWMGLRVDDLVDERLDPFAATPRAIDYLERLNAQFPSWFLTLAAYNAGPGRVGGAIRASGGGDVRDDALFLKIRGSLPPETRDFLPKYLAAAIIADDPASFGFDGLARDRRWLFDEAHVAGAASVEAIADAAGVPVAEVERLNPHLRLGLTPADASTLVRLPLGSGAGFADRLAAIPPSARVARSVHTVAPGETLWEIARYYRLSLEELRTANPTVEPKRLQVGTRLVIPGRDGVYANPPPEG